jgi:hypothetical protein
VKTLFIPQGHTFRMSRQAALLGYILTILLFGGFIGEGRAADEKLPIDKQISVEKQLLAEDYIVTIKTCRGHARKAAQESCIERRKAILVKAYKDLDRDPKAYFAAKARTSQDEKTLREARKLISTRKGS